MEAALGWLGELINAILSLIPRLIIVRTTHAGVKFRYGSQVIVITSNNGWALTWKWPFVIAGGIHIYWPLVTELELLPIERRTKNLEPQYLTTSDGVAVGVGGICVYRVRDIKKLLTKTWDHEDTINDYALAAVRKVVAKNLFDDLQKADIDAELTEQLKKDLRYYGIDVVKVCLNDFTRAFIIGHLGI